MSAKKLVDADGQKKAAAIAALKYVESGMVIGLGTGSTANHFIKALGEKVKKGFAVTGVPTSKATADLATSLGIKLGTLNDNPFIPFTFDGADEFDGDFRLIKGGGGALLIEKMVATSSKFVVTIADASKQVKVLGKFPLPVEIVPVGIKATAWKIEKAFDMCGMKPKMTLRNVDGKLFRTDAGNCIIDCACGEIKQPDRIEVMLNNIPGVVNNGLFNGISGIIFVGKPDGTVEELRRG
jgi:ribose 5-phosphate isomerase A